MVLSPEASNVVKVKRLEREERMTAGRIDKYWPGPDDKLVVTEMRNNPGSTHWSECHNFFRSRLERYSLPAELKEDIVKDVTQKAMLTVFHNLANFRFECRFKTWLGKIAYSRLVDEIRELKRKGQWPSTQKDSAEDTDEEADKFEPQARVLTPEEKYIRKEVLREITAAVQEYIITHRQKERNRDILIKVFFEGYNQKEVAELLGVSSAVVSYVVRAAQRYLREKLGHLAPPPSHESPGPPS